MLFWVKFAAESAFSKSALGAHHAAVAQHAERAGMQCIEMNVSRDRLRIDYVLAAQDVAAVQAMLLCAGLHGETIRPLAPCSSSLPAATAATRKPRSAEESRRLQALEATDWNVVKAAELLGLRRPGPSS